MRTKEIKTFLLGKNNEVDGRQDSLAYNIEKNLFVVADGVSNSYHPEFVAEHLCQLFVTIDNICLFDNWNEFNEKYLLPNIKEKWHQSVSHYISSISNKRVLRHEKINSENWKYGASTFCGVNIDEEQDVIKYFIIGDSTLLISTKNNGAIEINSQRNDDLINSDTLTIYDNRTEAISSDGRVIGEWCVGEYPLSDVNSLTLMTDGIAKWHQEKRKAQDNPGLLLWDLRSDEEFCNYVAKCRDNGSMDDDIAIIMIKFNTQSLIKKKNKMNKMSLFLQKVRSFINSHKVRQ